MTRLRIIAWLLVSVLVWIVETVHFLVPLLFLALKILLLNYFKTVLIK